MTKVFFLNLSQNCKNICLFYDLSLINTAPGQYSSCHQHSGAVNHINIATCFFRECLPQRMFATCKFCEQPLTGKKKVDNGGSL